MESDRKKAVLNTCLELFISKGVSETSVRDLSNAINLQVSGIYYYFESKDDAVVTCAEEAAIQLENNLIAPALKDISDPERMFKRLFSRASEMAPMMRFFVQVCASPRYSDRMQQALDRLTKRYGFYSEKFAERLGCTKEKIEPYLYMTITSMTNYMIFGEKDYIEPQIEIVKNMLGQLE